MHVIAGWYDANNKFEPLTLNLLNFQSTGEIFNKKITHQLKSMINAGIGVDYKLNYKFSLIGSFITDFSVNDSNAETNISLSRWDI